MELSSYLTGMKAGEAKGGGGGYTLPPATSDTLGGVKVGDGISVDSDGTISVSGGGGSSEPTFVVVDKLTEDFINAIGGLCEFPEVPLMSSGAWQSLPHLDISRNDYPIIYNACCTIFDAFGDGEFTVENLYLLYNNRVVPWYLVEFSSYPGILVKINDFLFVIYMHDNDTIGNYNNPFYMTCSPIKEDLTLYPYYIIDVRPESVEVSHTGGPGQDSTYNYSVDFTGYDAVEDLEHVAVLYNNIIELLNGWGSAYKPNPAFYRGFELKNFLFYLKTPHFSTAVPVYCQVWSDNEGKSTISFSSMQTNNDNIQGEIQLSETVINSFTYTESFKDNQTS